MKLDKRIAAAVVLAAASFLSFRTFSGKQEAAPFGAQDLRDALRSDDGQSSPPAAGGGRFERAASALEGLRQDVGADFTPVPAAPPEPAPAVGAAAVAEQAPQPVKSVDLSGEFPDPAKRDQRDIGDCHDFSSVGLLEAAIYRKTGLHKKLSEADLFLTRTLASGDAYEGFVDEGETQLTEGNYVAVDVRYALRRGVAWSLDYAPFDRLYDRYKTKENAELARLEARLQRYPRYQTDPEFAKAKREMWAQTLNDTSLPPEMLAAVKQRFPELESERAQTLQLTTDLARKHVSGGEPDDWRHAPPSKCADKEGRIGPMLAADLDAGVPVAVSADIGDLDAWNTRGSGQAMHAFLLIGYTSFSDGSVRFKTRNSWAGMNPDFLGTDLCRIQALDKVLVPSDPATR